MPPRSTLPATNTPVQMALENSPPPALAPLLPVPPLDLTEYGAELYSEPDLPLPGGSSSQNPGVRPTNADELSRAPIEQPQSILDGVASPRMGGHAHHLLSRPSFRAMANRNSSYPAPPQPRTYSPASAPTTPYMSAYRASTDLGSQSGVPSGPTPPTAEALSFLGPPPGNGPGHVKKLKQRISIWAEEMAIVNETQPTKPLPKPLKEWERLGRRVLKRRGQEEWPGPMQDGERVDKTGMYAGERPALSDGQFWGPHPELNRGTSPFPPSPELQGNASPDFPTRNILIDNNDGAADSSDALKLSPATTSSNEQDLAKKARIAADERLDRAAKLLAKQQKKGQQQDAPGSSDDNVIMSEKAPAEPKRHIDIMDWRKSLGLTKP